MARVTAPAAAPRTWRTLVSGYADAYRGLRAEVWVLALVMLVNRAGTMVMPFLSLYLTRELGMGTAAVGGVLAAYGAGAVAGSFLGGRCLRAADPLRVQAGSLAATGAGFFVLAGLADPLAVLGWVFVLGALTESFRPANAAALSAFAPPAVRRRAFALNRLAVNLGMGIGPAVGGLLAGFGYRWLFAVDGATCIAAALGMAALFGVSRAGTAREEPADEGPAAPRGARWWRDGRYLAFLGCTGLVLLIFMQVSSAYPLYLLEHHGVDEAAFGLLLSAGSVLLVVLEVPVTHRTEAVDARRILAAGALLVGLGFGLTPLAGGALSVLPLVAVWTAGEILIMPASMAAASHSAADGDAGRLAAYFATFSVAFILAPVVGLGLYEASPALPWWVSLALGPVVAAGFLANAGISGSQEV